MGLRLGFLAMVLQGLGWAFILAGILEPNFPKSRLKKGGIDGDVCSFLTASLSMLRSMLHADTQDVESANKIVTRELDAAPGQNPALTAARLAINKSVTAGDSRVSRARAHMLPLMDAVSDTAQAHFHTPAYLALMNDPTRYVLPGHTRVTLASAALPDRATVDPLPLCDAARAAASRMDQSAVSAHADADAQDGLVTDTPHACTTEEDAWARVWELKLAKLIPKSSEFLTAKYVLQVGGAHSS